MSVAGFSCDSPSEADDARSVPDLLPSLVFFAKGQTESAAAGLGSSWLELALQFDFGVVDEAVFRLCMLSNKTLLEGNLAPPVGKGLPTPSPTAAASLKSTFGGGHTSPGSRTGLDRVERRVGLRRGSSLGNDQVGFPLRRFRGLASARGGVERLRLRGGYTFCLAFLTGTPLRRRTG